MSRERDMRNLPWARGMCLLVATISVAACSGAAAGGSATRKVSAGSAPPRSAAGVATAPRGPGEQAESARWVGQNLGVATLESVSCPSVSFCMALGEHSDASRETEVYIYRRGKWSVGALLDSHTQQDVVSCASSSFCVAVDSVASASPAGSSGGYAYVFSDGRWSAPRRIDPEQQLDAVSCPSSSFCVAVDFLGTAFVYRNGQWSGPQQMDRHGYLVSVSCPMVQHCVAVDEPRGDSGGGSFSYSDGTWVAGGPLPVGQGGTPTNVSCWAPTACRSIDSVGRIDELTDGVWTADGKVPTLGVSGLSCESARSCVVVAGSEATSLTNGSWSLRRRIDPGVTLRAVSCTGSAFCAAVGEGAFSDGDLNATGYAALRTSS